MAKGREIKLPLPAADDLFSTQEERDEAKREYVADIPLELYRRRERGRER